MANPYGKTRPANAPYEVWRSGGWEWRILKLYKTPENSVKDEYARAFCLVVSPFCPDGELGDVYLREIHQSAERVA